MDMGGMNWGLILIALVLIAVVIAVLAGRKKGGAGDPDRTEQATHDVYDEEEKARREEDGDG